MQMGRVWVTAQTCEGMVRVEVLILVRDSGALSVFAGTTGLEMEAGRAALEVMRGLPW